MTSPTKILYELAGSPVVIGCNDLAQIEPCWLCGFKTVRGVSVRKWQGAQFTDQNKVAVPDSDIVCDACVWACSWVPPPGFPLPEPGSRGLNLRLYSHLWDAGKYRVYNKADKDRMLEWLRCGKRGPWFAAIADTGQKHVVPWTPLNAAGGYGGEVRFEERSVRLPADAAGWDLVDGMVALLAAGVTKSEIMTGEFSVRSYRDQPTKVLEFEKRYGLSLRGSAWFELAAWLAQKPESKKQEAKCSTRKKRKR